MATEPTRDPAVRPSLEEYGTWLKKKFTINITAERNRYERESARIKAAADSSPFWLEYKARKTELADAYFARTTYPLFADSSAEELLVKPWASFFEKTYRENVSDNPSWPDEPANGWLLPANWYQRIHDIARTSIVVKYLDGVKELTKFFSDIAQDQMMSDFFCSFEARDTGYYAAHTRVGLDFNLLIENWSEVSVRGQFEVQITTQLQEVIRRLTHKEYEVRRLRDTEPTEKWQWDYSSDSFKPNYLGHILHYMEGMIMEVRERKTND